VKYKQLGRTGLFVSEICLGTMTFGASKEGTWGSMSGLDAETVDRAMGALGQAIVDRIVASALAAGVNFIDTADVYAGGQSEVRVGQALKNLGVARKDVVIATKVFNPAGPGPNDRGASRGHIMDAVRGSLERLGTDYIDLYQIHGYDRVTPLEETLRALDVCSAKVSSAISVFRTGSHTGSRRRLVSAKPRALRASRRCRPTTRSPRAT
jgi:aryl-alcohol dehydrogenase-like predicted oxidoreductase